MIPIMTTSEESGNSGLAKNSPVNVSPELLAEAIHCIIRRKQLPKEVSDILINAIMAGSYTATYCLEHLEFFSQIPFEARIHACANIDEAVKSKEPYAIYIKGCSLLNNSSRQSVDRGIGLLNKVAEDGIAEGYWALAEFYARVASPEAIQYALKAVNNGWAPAQTAMYLTAIICKMREQELSTEHNIELKNLLGDYEALQCKIDATRTASKNIETNCIEEIKRLQMRCEEAESRLASWSAEALKDEHILKLQSSMKKAEEDWLEAKCAQETAEAKQIKAETIADDLTRRNKRLAGLLRINGIQFNEYESSSPSEGGPQ